MSTVAKISESDYVLLVRASHIASLSLAACFMAWAPASLAAQGTSCSERQTVLWSQVPEQNWPATQSLLAEIPSDSVVGLSVSTNGEAPLSAQSDDALSPDPKAEKILEALRTAAGPSALPERPGICLTELDPTCVRDPGSSTPTHLPQVERCDALDSALRISPQVVTALRTFARTTQDVGPYGVRSTLERPPRR